MQHLFSMIGATEYGWFHCIEGGSEKWDALKFITGIGYRLDEISDDIYELVIVKDPKTDKFHGIFETFPDIDEYRTRDLYSQTSAGSGWWRYKGRADDLIVLSNGEKINPIPLENIIRTHPRISAALVVGEYQFNPSLLLELESGEIRSIRKAQKDVLDDIWPIVQEANKTAPGFSKIPKSLILIAAADKPFKRAGKGTVQRQATVKLYTEELHKLFSSQQTSLLTEGLSLMTPISSSIVKTFIREIYQQIFEMRATSTQSYIDSNENVFEKGLDSLGVVVIVQRLKAALVACGAEIKSSAIDARLIYSAPSINEISDQIIALVENRDPNLIKDPKDFRTDKLERLLKKYTRDIPSINSDNNVLQSFEKGDSGRDRPWKVVLTGTTGSLGSHLLSAFDSLPESQVAQIYCLNRSDNAREKQKKASLSRGLKDSWPDSRVKFLHVDLSLPQLGLASEVYGNLIDEASVIIHSAWPVDFNLNVETFEPHIRGVRNLLDLSFHSKQKAPFIFVSSISTALGSLLKSPGSSVPEAIIHDHEAPEHIGYGESKYVSELLIEEFSKTSGITASVLRTGQIAGPVLKRGSFNRQEWFPSIIASSKYLNVLPQSLATFENIDWIPVDIISTIIVEVVNGLKKKDNRIGETHVYNLANPKSTSWANLLPTAKSFMGISKTLPFDEWVNELEKSIQDNSGIVTDLNPAGKLLNFFQRLSSRKAQTTASLPAFETAKLQEASKHASQLEAVSPEWLRIWLEPWKS